MAAEIAEEIMAGTTAGRAGGDATAGGRRERASGAARVLLDYCDDVIGAVDALLSVEMWEEARRISRSHSKEDLIKRCVESASSFARTCVVDLEERLEKFATTSDRYAVVLKIRVEAAANDPDAGGDVGCEGELSGSVEIGRAS